MGGVLARIFTAPGDVAGFLGGFTGALILPTFFASIYFWSMRRRPDLSRETVFRRAAKTYFWLTVVVWLIVFA